MTLSVLLLSLCASFLLSTAVHAAFPPNITSVSGCVDVGPITTQCVRPVRLTITGNGFLADMADPYNSLRSTNFYPLVHFATSATYPGSRSSCWADRDTINDTWLQCELPMEGSFNLFDFDVLLNVTYDHQRGDNSPPFPGISFKYLPTPHISSVEGCAAVSADGMTTSGCSPTSSVLTLHGSGFSSLNHTDFYIYLGTRAMPASLDVEWDSRGALSTKPGDYNDSRLTFSMLNSYNNLLTEEQYNGAPIPLYLANLNGGNGYHSRQYWASNSVYAQFVSLAPPTLSSIDNMCCNQACQRNASTGVMSDCTPGRTRIQLTGHYLYPGLNITVGGVLATEDVRAAVTSAIFYLPLSNFDPTKRYDLTVTTAAGNVTWPAAFSFIGSPVIEWVDPCIDTGYSSLSGSTMMKCLGGERITLHVANFDYSALTAVNLTCPGLGGPLSCTDVQPSVNDELLVTCVLPERWSRWSGIQRDVSMTAYFDTAPPTQSNTLNHLWVYDFVQSPRVTALVGCSTTLPASSLQLTQCQGGEVLTITGTHFNSTGITASFARQFRLSASGCSPLYVINDTTVECQLPLVDSTFQFDVPYQLTVEAVFIDQNNNPNPTLSNGMYITFVSDLPPSVEPIGDSSSSSSLPALFSSAFSSSTSSSSAGLSSAPFPSSAASFSSPSSSFVSSASSASPSTSSVSVSFSSSSFPSSSPSSSSSARLSVASSSSSLPSPSSAPAVGSSSAAAAPPSTANSSSSVSSHAAVIAGSVSAAVVVVLICFALLCWKRSAVLRPVREQRVQWSAGEKMQTEHSGGRVEMLQVRDSGGGYVSNSSTEWTELS